MTNLRETTLSESPLSVSREDGVIKSVKILGRESQNGRTYSDRALREAAKFYEGIKVNVDHPDRSNPNQERSFASFAGELDRCRVEESGVYGDLNVLKTGSQAEAIFEAAERFPKQFGLSHNAEGELVQKDGGWVVESIDCVHSVDIVSQPATNAGLFESVEQTQMKRTLREVVTTASRKRKGFKRVMEEMDEGGMLAEVADEEVIEAEVSAADAAVEALAKRANEIFKDPKIPPKEVGKKAAELAQMAEDVKEKLDSIEETASGESSDGAGGTGEEAVLPESVQKLQRDFNTMAAKNMLLEAGREATDECVAAVAAVPESKRQKLVESWPEKTNGSPARRPGKSPSIMESEGRDWTPAADSKEFASRLRKV